MKIIYVLLCSFLFLILFGCVNTSDPTNEILEIQTEFGVKDAFSPDTEVMNLYINELELLKSQNFVFDSVLENELSSAKAFYYFSKAIEQSKLIDYGNNHCNSQAYNQTINYLDLVVKESSKVNTNEYLFRPNQAQIVQGINITAKEMVSFLVEIC